MDLEQALARIRELEGERNSLRAERDGAVALGEQLRGTVEERTRERDAATSQVSALTSARDQAVAQLGEARTGLLSAERARLIAENAGKVVPELIRGDTVEALQASVGPATEAFARATDAAKAALAAERVPVGAGSGSAASAAAAANASPLEKISQGMEGRYDDK